MLLAELSESLGIGDAELGGQRFGTFGQLDAGGVNGHAALRFGERDETCPAFAKATAGRSVRIGGSKLAEVDDGGEAGEEVLEPDVQRWRLLGGNGRR